MFLYFCEHTLRDLGCAGCKSSSEWSAADQSPGPLSPMWGRTLALASAGSTGRKVRSCPVQRSELTACVEAREGATGGAAMTLAGESADALS